MHKYSLEKVLKIKSSEVVDETKKFWLPNIITVALVAIQILLLILFRNLPPQVPLFYSQKWGEARLTDPNFLWLLPTMCVLIVIFNYLLLNFTKRDNLLQKVLFWTMPTIAFFSLITLYNILAIVS